MTTPSDTPRTDTAIADCHELPQEIALQLELCLVSAGFARTLERELNEAKQNKHWLGDLEEIQQLQAELTQYKQFCGELAQNLEFHKQWIDSRRTNEILERYHQLTQKGEQKG